MGRKGSEVSPSKRYPLRSTHNSGRVLHSTSNKNTTAYDEPVNDNAADQQAARKRKSGASSGSPNNSVRVLRSASKNKNEAFSKLLSGNTDGGQATNVRNCVTPSKVGSPNNSVRLLRSASKNRDEPCSEPLDGSTAGEQATNGRKRVTTSIVGSPNKSVRMLRSASKNRDNAYSEPLDGSTVGEQAANGRKHVTMSKVGSPNNSVRVLQSASKNKDEACNEPLDGGTASEQAANRRKCVTPSKVGSPNKSVRVLRSASKNKNEAYSELLNDNTAAQPSSKKRKSGSPLKVGSPASGARVLRSNSKRTNETLNEPFNDDADAQPASRKRKTDTPSKEGSPKLVVRVHRFASKNDACVEALRACLVLALPCSQHARQQRQPQASKIGRLRTLPGSGVILRARTKLALNVSTTVQPAARKRKSGRSAKEHNPKKDYLKICQRVKYVLNRMNYEQSLIQAYAGEGWKGQSLEKIRPEKELERAKAEIVRCKIKIREAFRNMDSLLSKGKLEESLFDSAGQIFSEDIFCAICGSKDVTLQNDIILCDGACDRGFHQNCLNPPLLTEDIPPGDVGWFCPACMCKIDCMDAINELQGSKLSVHDSWEKVFPEAASDLPLCDPENNDYNPSLVEGHIAIEDLSSAKHDVDDLGLPSEDSEDDDFDPVVSDSSEDPKGKTHSEESDFTSDSDYFCAEIAKSFGQGETSVSPLLRNRAFTEMELDQDVVLPVSSRRQVERLDYKTLYDEAYGEESSSSTDDEEWSGNEKLEDSETDGSVRSAKRSSRRASAGHPISQHTPQSERHYASFSEQQTEVIRSNGSSTSRGFGPIIRQKLKDHFEKEPYPSRATKESLARELELTFIQVDKWFASTRHSSRVAAAKKEKCTGNHTTEHTDGTAVDSAQMRLMRAPNGVMLAELTADRNDMVHEKVRVQNNLDGRNKEDIQLPRAETETEAYEKESSDPSDDKEWSGTSASQEELDSIETDSLAASNCAERLAKRAPAEPQNNKHTPLTEWLQGSVNEKLTEAPFSNGRSSKAQKYHFGPIVNQKLKVHFEKDPYPSRSTVQSLALELGLTLTQVHRWFKSSRHYSRVSTAKNGKDPGTHINEENHSTTIGSIQGKEGSYGVMENPNEERNDMVSQRFMLQINLNEGNTDDILLGENPSCKETIVTTPTAFLKELSPPGYGPGETQYKGALWNPGFEQEMITAPTTVSRDTPPGYGPGESQGFGASHNNISEQRILMTPTTTTMSISEVGPPGYGPGENQGNRASWNTSSEQRAIMTPTTSSRETFLPHYVCGESQVNGASWNSISEQRVNTTPSIIPSSVCPPAYGSGVNQVPDASQNTSTEQRVVMTPSTIPIEVGPPGYWPGELQGNSASWNNSCEESVFVTPTTVLSEVGPPGYWPRENIGNGASTNVEGSKGQSAEKPGLADEARKKAIARELRRMKKFR